MAETLIAHSNSESGFWKGYLQMNIEFSQVVLTECTISWNIIIKE